MEQAEISQMFKSMIKDAIMDNLEISIYTHGRLQYENIMRNGQRIEVELYYDGELIACDSMSIKEDI